ncbi:hypothetical protein ACIRBX_22585 [Kitasatospora sp. NPDC096147]|uniref:hypothetical protein n=1 Tax=Kitasatospora sp. NPDC096147 TaxID=3364093 RepID=UPI00381B15C2
MPTPNTPFVYLPDLLCEIEDGRIDVADFGRMWVPKLLWIAELWQSLLLVPQRPIGSVVLWLLDSEGRGRPGRYGLAAVSVRILDGQHRCLGLAVGAGVRPAWFTEQQWDQLKGDELLVSVALEPGQRPRITAHQHGRYPQITLRELLTSDPAALEQLAVDRGVGTGELATCVGSLVGIQERLARTPILLEWLSGTTEQAAEVYCIRGRRGATTVMTAGEIETTMVAQVSPGVRSEILDPAIEDAAAKGFSSAVTATAFNEVVQAELPETFRHRNVVNADPAIVRAACKRTGQACEDTLAYLVRHGISGSDFVCMPSTVRVLMKLFARFPHAVQDDFAWRWLARALASQRYRDAPKLARADSALIAASGTYEQATSLLAEALNGSGLKVGPNDLHRQGASTFGPGAALMAMALSGPGHRPVHDLAQPDLRAPHPAMRLVRLWDPNPPAERLGNYILATEATHRVLRANKGWTPAAAEELQCPRAVLDAQSIPQPLGEQERAPTQMWIKERDRKLLSLINAFLEGAA